MTKKRQRSALIVCCSLFLSAMAIGGSTLNVTAESVDVNVPTTALFTNATARDGGLVADINTGTTVDGVISGDLELEYSYMAHYWGDMEIAFFDKDNIAAELPVFSVYRGFGNGNRGQAAVIDYSTGSKAYHLNGSVVTWLTQIDDQWDLETTGKADSLTDMAIYPCPANTPTVPGKLSLTWESDTVTVRLTKRTLMENGQSVDKTEEAVMATLNIPNFQDGYVMKIYDSKEFRGEDSGSIKIHSINGQSLDTETLSCQVVGKEIVYKGEYTDGTDTIIDVLQGKDLHNFTCNNACTLTGNNGGAIAINSLIESEFTISDTFADKAVGLYDLAVSQNGISKAYKVNVVESKRIETEKLFKTNAMASDSGLVVGVDTVAEMNGIISGDLEVEYVYAQQNWGDFEFGFYDKDAPDTLVFSIYRGFGYGNYGQAGVIDHSTGSKKYYMLGRDLGIDNLTVDKLWDTGNGDDNRETLPGCDHAPFEPGKIVLSWQEDTVTISVTIKEGGVSTEVVMATLSIPNFKDGYIMKMYDSSEIAAGRDSSVGGVKLLSINGEALLGNTVIAKPLSDTKIEYLNDAAATQITCGKEALGDFALYGNFEIEGIELEALKETFQYDISTLGVGTHNVEVTRGTITQAYDIVIEENDCGGVGHYIGDGKNHGKLCNTTGVLYYIVDGNFVSVDKAEEYSYSVTDDKVKKVATAEFAMEVGAYVRLSATEPGIRFKTNVGANLKSLADTANNVSGVEFGTIFLPTSLLNGAELTLETAAIKDIPQTKWHENCYQAAIIGIPEDQYGTALSARGYVKITLTDDTQVVLYTEYTEENNSRSIKYVAQKAIDAGAAGNDAAMAILKTFAGIA